MVEEKKRTDEQQEARSQENWQSRKNNFSANEIEQMEPWELHGSMREDG
jgi:hypothetical protein